MRVLPQRAEIIYEGERDTRVKINFSPILVALALNITLLNNFLCCMSCSEMVEGELWTRKKETLCERRNISVVHYMRNTPSQSDEPTRGDTQMENRSMRAANSREKQQHRMNHYERKWGKPLARGGSMAQRVFISPHFSGVCGKRYGELQIWELGENILLKIHRILLREYCETFRFNLTLSLWPHF